MVISKKPNENVKCSGGVCFPTAKDAILNVAKLQHLLGASDVKITTGPDSISSEVKDIVVAAPLSWASSSKLIMDAYRSVSVRKSVVVTGSGGLDITTNDGAIDGSFAFSDTGSIQFWDLGSSLIINGSPYVLVSDIGTLANDIAISPDGNYGLAKNYDASGDGTYSTAVVTTTFNGNFNGLGNRIFNLSIDEPNQHTFDYVGLFAQIAASGTASDLNLINVNIVGLGAYEGGLAGYNAGQVRGVFVSGSVAGNPVSNNEVVGGLLGSNDGTVLFSYSSAQINNGVEVGGLIAENGKGSVFRSHSIGAVSGDVAGGLVASNGGIIQLSYATGQVSSNDNDDAGGLVAVNGGTVDQSFATGPVSGGNASAIGGMAGLNFGGHITQSYSIGSVTGGPDSIVGGFLGYNNSDGDVSAAYSTGAVMNASGGYIGGFVGFDNTPSGSFKSAYWDTDSSGIAGLTQGAGNIPNDPGIKGKSTADLQAQLPKGFSLKVWAETSNVNNGLPYLVGVPPP